MTRAVIADDEPLMREQLRARLDELWPELEIVAEAKNGVEAVEQVAALRPEVVFLDIRMPGKTGIEAAREIAALDPAQFWQIHRSTLINTRAIAGIIRDERGHQLVAVKGRPEKLEVSRSYAHLFKGM